MLLDAETYEPTGIRKITKKMSSLLSNKHPIMINAVMEEDDYEEESVNPDLIEMSKEYKNVFDTIKSKGGNNFK
uniref:Uncharacterized protein n=1 Tax=Panagrolaimus sp. ES5 TaxID=591445 RepID=A0AC34FZ19_9BILA